MDINVTNKGRVFFRQKEIAKLCDCLPAHQNILSFLFCPKKEFLYKKKYLSFINSFFFFFNYFRELKKAQMAKAAAEERVLFTDRMTTRSTVQSNRNTRIIGKKINRSVSLTIY